MCLWTDTNNTTSDMWNTWCCRLWHGKNRSPWRQCWSSFQIQDIKWLWLWPHSSPPWIQYSPTYFCDLMWVHLNRDSLALRTRMFKDWCKQKRDWRMGNVKKNWKPTPQKEGLSLMQLEHDMCERQHFFLWEIGPYLSWPCVRYYKLVHSILLLLALHNTLCCRHGRTKTRTLYCWCNIFVFQPFVSWSNNVMFANTNFNIAQNPYIGLHCPTFFGYTRGQSSNVPLGSKTIWL